MPGSIRAIRRALDPVRGRGRIPLSKARTPGHPEFRTTGSPALSRLEDDIADAIVGAVDAIPHETFLNAVVSGDVFDYGREVLDTLAGQSERIEAALMAAYVASGEAAAIEIGNDLARDYRRVGKSVRKADTPSPSEVALRFRFDRTDPRAIDWVRRESGTMITNMVRSEQDAIRAVIDSSFSAQQTVQQTGRGVLGQLRTVNPSAGAREFADALGSNLNGLTRRYETAVVNRVTALADDLADRGITGTKALDRMRKEGDRYAERLRKARSRTIARTERMRAHNQARLLSFQQAIDSGVASAEYSRKQWKTGPFDVCEICVAMQGQERKVAEAFTLPNGGQVDSPPAHPNCRCTMTMRTDTRLYQPPENLGTGTLGDPFRTAPRDFTDTGRRAAGQGLPTPPTPAQPLKPRNVIPRQGRQQRVLNERRSLAADYADQYEVTPDEVLMFWDDVPRLREQARREAVDQQNETFALMDSIGPTRLPDPRNAQEGSAVYYDWLEQVHPDELRRLKQRGWISRDARIAADDVDADYAAAFRLESTGLPGQALEEHWLRLTRQYDSLNMIRLGRIPKNFNRFGGRPDFNKLLPQLEQEGYDLNALFRDRAEAAAMIARKHLYEEAEEAFSILGRAAQPLEGSPAWRMSFQSWEEEVRTLEYARREYGITPLQQERLDELVPVGLDTGQDYEELYALIIETARFARLDVADYATIPWA